MQAPDVDLASDTAALAGMLRSHGLADAGETPVPVLLTGGVSSSIFRVDLKRGPVCVKQALAKLKVEKEWFAPTRRVFAEVAWLQAVQALAPDRVPQVLAVDRGCGAFVMEYLPNERYPTWKSQLLRGQVDRGVASALGATLGLVHAASAGDRELQAGFDNAGDFFSLRLEPYLVETARQNPDLAVQLVDLVHTFQHTSLVLVHGDVSPKNILVGPAGPVILDAECACVGDPAFDLAFLLNHLLLKAVHLPPHAQSFIDAASAVIDAYTPQVRWESVPALEHRTARLLGGLLLARVDGKSPVEYLSADARALVRTHARRLVRERQDDLAALLREWLQVATHGAGGQS